MAEGERRTCTKVSYRNVHEAGRAIRGQHRNGRLGLRAYRCPECNRWHLTKRRLYA